MVMESDWMEFVGLLTTLSFKTTSEKILIVDEFD